MAVKIIATDLDGTLMMPDHLTVSVRTVNALENAHKRGVKIAVATGRPMSIIGSVIEQIPFTDYIIYANGASVYDRENEKIIYSNLIDRKTAKKVISKLLEIPVFFEIYISGVSHYQLDRADYFDLAGLPEKFVNEVMKDMAAHENILEVLDAYDIEKISLYAVKAELVEPIEQLFISNGLTCSSSLKNNLESTVSGADKGEALKEICKIIGAEKSEVMTFGDAGNDCEMLEYADLSFAMANATDECKASAKFLADSNANDGLAKAVEEYVLNQRN